MYRMRIRRMIDFAEKCNTPFVNSNTEFVSFLMEGLRKGEIQGYNDSLNKTIPKKKVSAVMKYEDPNDPQNSTEAKASQLNFIYIDEDLLFDRQRSQTKYDIQSISLVLPMNTFGGILPTFDTPIATLRYKDVEKFLDSKPTARWKNPYNNAEDRKISEAFRLRLFCSHITKMMRDNPQGQTIDQIDAFTNYGADSQRGPLLASQNYEYLLVSMENELYEY
jgi:Gliding motility associated protein GldN